ncbi:MAG: hypothetical protein ACOXZS_03485 [Bacilli bacterium]|jgi:hypothetical protein
MKKKQKKMIKTIETQNMTKVVLVTIGFFLFMYIVTALITGEIKLNHKKESEDPIPVSIQYDEILAGETFNRPETEYYVIFYEYDDVYARVIDTAINKYSQKDDSLKIYKVNLNNPFNTSIYDEDNANTNTSDINKLKVANYTLIKVKNKKNISVVKGKDKIVDHFQD